MKTMGNRKAKVFALIALAALAIMFLPATALAEAVEETAQESGNPLDALGTFLSGIVDGTLGNMFNALFDFIVSVVVRPTIEWFLNAQIDIGTNMMVTGANYLYGSLGDILGQGLLSQVIAVSSGVVTTIANSIFAGAVLLQLYHLAERMDASNSLPVIHQVLRLAVFIVVYSFLLNNAQDILLAIYDVFTRITASFTPEAGQATDITAIPGYAEIFADRSNFTLGTLVGVLVSSLIGFLVSNFALIMVYVTVLARALQMYAFVLAAPIPIAMMAWEQTRSTGIAFFKNFMAAALANVITMFIVSIFPQVTAMILQLLGGSGAIGVTNATRTATSVVMYILMSIALNWTLVTSLRQTGAWAKDIIG